MKSLEEDRSTASKCIDKAGTRRNMLLIATIVIVTAIMFESELQIAKADGWGFEDESELNSVDVSAEDESGSDESLINDSESQTADEPYDDRPVDTLHAAPGY